MNGQTGESDNYSSSNHLNHHDGTTDDQCFDSQSVVINQLFTQSLENTNDHHSQLVDQQKHSVIHQDEVTNHHHHHQEQLSHQQQPSQLSLSSSSSTSSSSSLSSPFSSQTTEQSLPNQNTTNNNNDHLYVPRTKLFVGRLPDNCTSNQLEDLFRKYGQVKECDVVGRYGFVHMSKSEEAEECVKKLNRYSFMGSVLTVEFSTSKVHPEPGTLGRAKGSSRMVKGIRSRIHSHTPYHREPFINHRTSLGPPPLPHSVPLPPLRPLVNNQIPPSSVPPPPLPPGRLYGGYSSPYYQDDYRAYERKIYYEADYYGRERNYPPHDHRSSAGGGTPARLYSPPPTHPLPPYPIYPSHHNMSIRAYERPVIDEPIPMYTSRGSSMTPHKCHYHKCHYDMHVEPYLN
ncbi:uncharacterized protein LOC128398020 isoform X1 [Panonychus citri]|uniref:uncharacterized protein LOC128398020 isoform X1 n=1 Tax=Panonychus citri TaxID=50023 RepID=UPI002306FB50|nr:uncharacterized protein LOC128398020 isoform X1 [Panonychus citri]